MTLSKARDYWSVFAERLKRTPLPIAGGVLVALLAITILGVIGLSGPTYVTLYDGLSPGQGGAVIEQLQKLGISYKLAEAGNVIEVPQADLGRARLELGKTGDPASPYSGDQQALEKAPMTASQAAVRAMKMQATQSRIEAAIEQMSGARHVRVLLAIPRYTPFLADQPLPKASIVLTGAPQADQGLGMAVAQLVAGSVPGLAVNDVVVETGRGQILYPVTSEGTVAQQLFIQQHIEDSQEAKIRSILTPIFGAPNYRIAVSADVDFARKTINSMSYGPKSYSTSEDIRTERKIGSDYPPLGIPGALSNQPPGPTTAPVPEPPANPGQAAAKSTLASSKRAKSQMPRSSSKHEAEQFAIDQTHMIDRRPAWQIKNVSVSVVIATPALGKLTTQSVQSMVAAAVAVPTSSVTVATAAFVSSSRALVGNDRVNPSGLIKAGLMVLAALAGLFGVAIPARRWLIGLGSRSSDTSSVGSDLVPRIGNRLSASEPSPEPTIVQVQLRELLDQIRNVADMNPATIARTLQHWALEPVVAQRKD